MSEGVSALGPIYKAVSVRTSDRATWLTAKREGNQEILDGERMMMDIDEEVCRHQYLSHSKNAFYHTQKVKMLFIKILDFDVKDVETSFLCSSLLWVVCLSLIDGKAVPHCFIKWSFSLPPFQNILLLYLKAICLICS